MKGRIVITPAGQIRIFTDEGSLADGIEIINDVFEIMKAAGIELTDISPVEQHRHDENGNHVHAHADGTVHAH